MSSLHECQEARVHYKTRVTRVNPFKLDFGDPLKNREMAPLEILNILSSALQASLSHPQLGPPGLAVLHTCKLDMGHVPLVLSTSSDPPT